MKFTDFLAIYASLLSSAGFVWSVIQSRPRIKVDLVFGVETIDGVTTSGVFVVVRNVSSYSINLAAISLLYPYARAGVKEWILHLWRYRRWPGRLGWCHTALSNFSIKDGCPLCLEARKSHHVFVPKEVVEEVLAAAKQNNLIATVQDQLWKCYYSRPFQMDTV